jgi:phosphatidylglycerol:prolipoprotein diacylglycerol transferase
VRRAARRGRLPLAPEDADALLGALVLGVVGGARLGYAVFYNLPHFAANPLRLFALWEGGMSFHGGLAGAALGAWWFARGRGVSLLAAGDVLALAAPLGLFFGRLANFVNGELYGRVSSVPWAMVFPGAGPLPRHPSQLYEAFLEGPILWVLVWWAGRSPGSPQGLRCGAFVAGYGVLRFLVELTREPDAHLGLVLGGLSMGQVLSAAMALAGGWLLWRARLAGTQGD